MTNLPDDQMTFDIPDDFHEPVTEERVTSILNILFVPPQYDKALKSVVLFLKPTQDELPIIENVVKDWCGSTLGETA
jgi:hypothetical protein